MTDLSGLIERVEAATSNDPELFWKAQRIVNPEPSSIWVNEQRKGWTPEYAAYIERGHRFDELIDAGAFLDAAMTLAPAGRRMSVQQRRSYETFWVSFLEDGSTNYDATGRAKTLALAITAASLRAHQSRKDG